MNIIGLSRHHNGTTTVIRDGVVLLSIEEERLNRFKHEASPFLGILETSKYIKDVDYVSISGLHSLEERFDFSNTNSPFVLCVARTFIKNKTFNVYDLHKKHHLTHAAGSFYNSGFDRALSFVFDGDGSKNENNETEGYSCYDFSYDGFTLVEKQYQKRTSNVVNTFDKETFSLGRCFEEVSKHLGFNNFFDSGKVMGLASYGKDINLNFLDFLNNNYDQTINKNHFLYEDTKNLKDFQKSADLAFSLQKYTQDKLCNIVTRIIQQTDCKNICLSGGFIMNCVSNFNLRKKLPKDINIYVEPIAHDGGTSIGGAKLVYYELTKSKEKFPQTTTYYGLKYDLNDIKEKIKHLKTKEVTKEDVAKILQKDIVAIWQGRSEQGPRALGNRSILFNPKLKNGKDIVNVVKKREWFRPFAGTILFEHTHDYFDMAGLEESPFMTYAVDVKKDKVNEIPAITHVDNTCRIQTLKKEYNKHFYELIEEFYKLTGTPILLNTSFNLAGDPMVETIEDAIETLNGSDLKYVYLPELNTLIEK